MPAVNNVEWEQGEDFIMNLRYVENENPVDLTNYSVRMDIAIPAKSISPERKVMVINSDDVTVLDSEGSPLDHEGASDNEVSVDSEGNINIFISRFTTLPGGPIGDRLNASTVFIYDLFVRDNTSNRQKKLVKGEITINRSVTQWT